MIELLSSRSRVQTGQRCSRARYWLDEAQGTGFSPAKVAVPLATGGAVHSGLESLLLGFGVENAVEAALEEFRAQCTGRQLDIEVLESQSFVFQEQMALTEALVRLVGTRVLSTLLKRYEVLEVERMDRAELVLGDSYSPYCQKCGWEISSCSCGPGNFQSGNPEWSVMWRSIPDALVRDRESGDLYIISWKTTTGFDLQKDQDARTDMQGLSEAWGCEERFRKWQKLLRETGRFDGDGAVVCGESIPQWFLDHLTAGGSTSIRGVQMIYLVKGQRRKRSVPANTSTIPTEMGEITECYQHQSPLIYGYRRLGDGSEAPGYATDLFWQCSEPHPFRWAKGGICPGGKNHKRGDEWASFAAWATEGGIRAWLELLEKTEPDTLDAQWAMPVPHFRTRESVERWLRQTRAAESRHARDLLSVRELEAAWPEESDPAMKEDLWERLQIRLDECFPQTTEMCGNWFHRKCPVWDICHGPGEVARDPVGSGLFQVKEQYEQAEVSE